MRTYRYLHSIFTDVPLNQLAVFPKARRPDRR
jgi:hypothetical protein